MRDRTSLNSSEPSDAPVRAPQRPEPRCLPVCCSRIVFGRTAVLALLLSLAWLLAGPPLRVVSSAAPAMQSPGGEVPAELGTVVYRVRGDAPVQLYIVANSHRSAITGANGVDTLQAQVETFRIGEWLIRHRQLDLLLPESYFGGRPETGPPLALPVRLDHTVLVQRLADTATFVNAELLLHEQYGIGLLQVEDRDLYHHIRELLHTGLDGAARLEPGFDARLAYLQKCRSAALLQAVPAVLAQHSRREDGTSSGALLTVGLAHLGDILEFLETGEVHIPAPPAAGDKLPAVQSPLTLCDIPVGITVIVPNSLLGSLPPASPVRG